MTQKEINEIIEEHKHWLKEDCEGWELMRANFSEMCLQKADFSEADLRGAKFDGARLREADFSMANFGGVSMKKTRLFKSNFFETNFCEAELCESEFCWANLHKADFKGAKLQGANFYGANLSDADFRGADLDGVDIREANINGACFIDAKNVPYIPFICPEAGSFIGWKRVGKYIVKLEIPTEAKRSSATTRQCRCEFAKVLEIYTADGEKAEVSEIVSTSYAPTTYKVGEIVYPDSFDEDRWRICSHGIYFFINKQEAIDYKE